MQSLVTRVVPCVCVCVCVRVRVQIHELVQSGRDASVNFVDPLTGRTALHTAAEGGMSSLVVQLGMAPGVDVNIMDATG